MKKTKQNYEQKNERKNKRIYLAVGLSTIAVATAITLPIINIKPQKMAVGKINFAKMNFSVKPIANIVMGSTLPGAVPTMFDEGYKFDNNDQAIVSLKGDASTQIIAGLIANIKINPALIGLDAAKIKTYSDKQLGTEIKSWFDFDSSVFEEVVGDHLIGENGKKVYPYRTFIYDLKLKKNNVTPTGIVKIPVLSYISASSNTSTIILRNKLDAALKYEIKNNVKQGNLTNMDAYQNSNLTGLYHDLDQKITKLETLMQQTTAGASVPKIEQVGLDLIKAISTQINALRKGIVGNLEANQKNSLSWINNFLRVDYSLNNVAEVKTKMDLEIKIEHLDETLQKTLPKLNTTSITTDTTINNASIKAWFKLIEANIKSKSTTDDEIETLNFDLSNLFNAGHEPISFTYHDLGSSDLKGDVKLSTANSSKNVKFTIFKDYHDIKTRLIAETTANKMLIATDFDNVSRNRTIDNLYLASIQKIIDILKTDEKRNNRWNKGTKKPYEIFYELSKTSSIEIKETSKPRDILQAIHNSKLTVGKVVAKAVAKVNIFSFELTGKFGYRIGLVDKATSKSHQSKQTVEYFDLHDSIYDDNSKLIFGINNQDYIFLSAFIQLRNVFNSYLADDVYNNELVNGKISKVYNDLTLKAKLVAKYNQLNSHHKIAIKNVVITNRTVVDSSIGSVVEMNVKIEDSNKKVIYDLGTIKTHSKRGLTSDEITVDSNNKTITWNYANGKIKSQIKVDKNATGLNAMGTQTIVGADSTIKDRFYFTEIKLNGDVTYNGLVENLDTNVKVQKSLLYIENESAFNTAPVRDDKAIVMIDKLTGQLYVLHSETTLNGGTLTVKYDVNSKEYTWSLGAVNGKFGIETNLSNHNPRQINVTIV